MMPLKSLIQTKLPSNLVMKRCMCVPNITIFHFGRYLDEGADYLGHLRVILGHSSFYNVLIFIWITILVTNLVMRGVILV